MPRHWHPLEQQLVRDHFGRPSDQGGMTLAEMAEALERSYASVRTWIQRHGLVSRRQLTPAEEAHIRQHYGTVSAAAIAAHLGKAVKTIWVAAVRLGVARKGNRMTLAGQRTLRRMAAAGHCNRCIGRAIKLGRQEVRRWRVKLGLPPVSSRGMLDSCRSCKERTRANTRRQLERAGLKSLGEVRVAAFRAYARRHGWPEDLRPRAVQILEVLRTRGPMTQRQIAEAVGMPWKGSRKSLASNDPEGTYLAHLMRRGLVICLGRLVRGTGSGHSTCLYSLSLTAERSLA